MVILQRLQDGVINFPSLRLSEEIILIQTKLPVCLEGPGGVAEAAPRPQDPPG